MTGIQKLFLFLSRFFIFAAAAAPFFWSSNFFFPYTFTKTFLFRASAELAFLFWLPLAASSPAYRLRSSRILAALLSLFALGWVSAFFGPNFKGSFWSDYERMMGLLTYSHFIMFVAVAISVFREEKWWERIFLFSLGISGLVALYGIWQKIFLEIGRIESTFGNAAFLASYLLIHIFIALACVARERKVNAKSGYAALILFMNAVTLLFTGTRGAMIGLGAGSMIFLALLAWPYREKDDTFFSLSQDRVKKYSRILLGLFLAMAVLFFFFRENLRQSDSALLSRFASLSFGERTVRARLISWQMAWKGIQERPILGWGPENFILLSNKHYDPRLYDQEAWFDRAHNLFFDLTAAKGIAGLALLLYLVWLLLHEILRKDRFKSSYERAALAAAVAAYLVNDVFVFDNAATLIPIALGAAYLANTKKISPPNLGVGHPSGDGAYRPFIFYSAFGLAAIVAVVSLWQFSIGPAARNFRAHAAWEKLYSSPDKASALKEYEETASNGAYLDLELNRALADFVIDVKREGISYGGALDSKMFATALLLIGRNIELDSQNARWLVYQGNLYNLSRAFDPSRSTKAEEIFVRALTLSPRRQQIYFDLAQAQFDQGKIDEALKNIEVGIALEPKYLAGYRHKAAFLVLSGRTGAEEIINFLRNDFERRDESFAEYWDIFADAYFKAKKFRNAAELYQETITYYERQTYPGRRLSLKALAERYARTAALWAMGGERDNAYQAALKVVEYDPSRRGEAEVFLRSIGTKLPSP